MKTTIQKCTKILLVFAFFVFSNSIFAQDINTQIAIGYQQPGKVDVKAFVLKNEATIQLEGYAGLFERMGNDLIFYGWILDSKSRKVVWNLLEAANDDFFSHGDPGRFSFKKEVKLPAGQYEIYYAAGMNYDRFGNSDIQFQVNDLGELFDLIFRRIDGEINDDYNKHFISKFVMNVSAPSSVMNEVPWDQKVNDFAKNSLVSIIRVGDNENIKRSFEVTSDVKLNILEIGEHSGGDLNDFAWIINSNTYEKVWPNAETKYRKAGGGNKNKTVFQTVTLPKGNYTLFYISDDSHSYDKWNVLPPYDPQFWGITIWPDLEDKGKVKVAEGSDPFALKLVKANDNSYISQGFTLKKDMKVRVISLGEASGEDEMADYGWIVNNDNHKTVWEFRNQNSKYAGGAEKNRIINEVLDLPKGNYTAYYVTDDSHAFNRWNDSPPLFADLWGLSIIIDSDKESFLLTDGKSASNDNVLVEIVKVRDDERFSKTFKLDKESKVRIYAIGEGVDGDMVDYGWIQNTVIDKVVWEMTFRTSEFAGGAQKNRMFDGNLLLPAGEYKVYYQTDDSHSYHDWNDSPPYDQDHYGISVYMIK